MAERDNGSILKRAAVTALGVFLGSNLISGISYDEPMTLLWAVLALSLFSAVLRPLMIFLALPLVVLSLGTGLLLINALLYMLAGHLIEGFEVAGFWSAFFGAFVISILNLFFSGWIGGGSVVRSASFGGRAAGGPAHGGAAPLRPKKAKDDVIDI